MPGAWYHTGIKRDTEQSTKSNQVWRRVSDGVQVQLEDWYPGEPVTWVDGYDFYYWYLLGSTYKNMNINRRDSSRWFICEYIKLEEKVTKLEDQNTKLEGIITKIEGENTKLEGKISKLDGIIAEISSELLFCCFKITRDDFQKIILFI